MRISGIDSRQLRVLLWRAYVEFYILRPIFLAKQMITKRFPWSFVKRVIEGFRKSALRGGKRKTSRI